MNKERIIDILEEMCTLLELKGENPFKCRAYSNAARALETLAEPLEKVIAEKRLREVKGIGAALEEQITELAATGGLAYYDELKASVPAGLLELFRIPALGPKKINALYDKLGVTSMDELENVCLEGKVAALPGFGEKTQQKIIDGINQRRSYAGKYLLGNAYAAARPLLERLRRHPDVIQADTAGALSRFDEIVDGIDLLASSDNPDSVITAFVESPGVAAITERGETSARVVLENGIPAELKCRHSATLQHSNSIMREVTLPICNAVTPKQGMLQIGRVTPVRFVAKLQSDDICGSLHNHSNWSDGRNSIDDIAAHMADAGYDYWAVTDHSRSSFQAHGLEPERLREQIAAIRKINDELEANKNPFRLLTGSEVDIHADGSLDFDDDLLAELDVVVASIHQRFSLSESEMTKRLIRAAENPCVHILGHLTGRLLLERDPYKVDQHAVIDACAETGTWIELNCNPARLDMDWRLLPYAKSKGVKCVINCDAHSNEHASFLEIGAGVARKGGLTKNDVINTSTLGELMKSLQNKRSNR